VLRGSAQFRHADEEMTMPTGAGVDWSKKDPIVEMYEERCIFPLRVLRNYRLAWCVAVAAIVAAIYLGFFRGDWRPTGDGRTVVHSRTGEIRVIPETPAPH
jgi:hypothetical protein